MAVPKSERTMITSRSNNITNLGTATTLPILEQYDWDIILTLDHIPAQQAEDSDEEPSGSLNNSTL